MIEENKLSDVIGTLQRLSSDIFSDAIQRKLILDNLSEGVFTVDRDLKVTSLNKSAERIIGISEDEALGKVCDEVLPPALDEEFCIVRQVLENERKPLQKLTRHLKIGSKNIPVLVSASALEDSSGRIVGGVQSFQEITEIFHHQLILDNFFDGVFTVDTDYKITSFNRAAEMLTGFAQEQVIGKIFSTVFSTEKMDMPNDRMPLVKAMKTGEAAISEMASIKTAEEQTLPVSIRAVPLLDPTGDLIGGVASFRDNTGAIQSRHILDSVADGVFTVDNDFRITSFNRSAEKITGYTNDEVIGRKCSDVFCGSVCGTACPVTKAQETHSDVLASNVVIQGKMGRQIPVSISVTPLVDENGIVIGGVETFRDRTEILSLRSKLVEENSQSGISSKSPKMKKIMSVLPEFAKSKSNILVLGESGTGKEVIATAIHRMSDRNKEPFVAVNCGALPDTLLESELFGYKAGAFTDAKKDKKGRFAAAEKGTLFLDEIGDISSALQVKLLRVLQSRTYEPLGSNTPVKTEARIIAATNKNLEVLVQEGRFREDLYYRLNVVKIELPPLSERLEDLPFLVEFFIQRFNKQRNRAVKGISDEALSLLLKAEYPGNIRELENIIEYAFILCNEGFILPHHLPDTIQEKNVDNTAVAEKESAHGGEELNFPNITLEEVEKRAIIQTLKRNNFKRMQTCRDLGISKDTLRRKLQSYGDIVQENKSKKGGKASSRVLDS
ncbi:MAG: sigma 54-interacting transcriptional regulator [Desulfobulbaceae bacterium]|nr:sigma 54-interacting transcriptional regulator [Desulfobulbaceae bacterium]